MIPNNSTPHRELKRFLATYRKARDGMVIAIVTEGDEEIRKLADHVIYIPKTLYILSSILAVVPLQLLAYYTTTDRKLNPDYPKNLAKIVVVE